jgi:hypothetical protein
MGPRANTRSQALRCTKVQFRRGPSRRMMSEIARPPTLEGAPIATATKPNILMRPR